MNFFSRRGDDIAHLSLLCRQLLTAGKKRERLKKEAERERERGRRGRRMVGSSSVCLLTKLSRTRLALEAGGLCHWVLTPASVIVRSFIQWCLCWHCN